jgi:hypothetical protein
MNNVMRAIDTLVDTGDADMDAPCYTDADGTNPYYTPVQYLCVLNKVIMLGKPGWASELAIKMHMMGAHYEPSKIWNTEMKDHATMLLTRHELV